MTDSTNQVSSKHPHEPEKQPVYDSEGRCLVCGCEYRDEQIADLKVTVANVLRQYDEHTAERDRYRQALDAIDNLDPRNFRKSFFESMSGGPESDFEAAFRAVCRIVNGCLHDTDENGRPLQHVGQEGNR